MSKIIEDLNWRYATKKFNPDKKIPEDELHEILEATRLSPSSFGLQPWKFVVVENKELREKLKGYSFGQPQITDASHLIILCVRTDMDEAHIRKFIKSVADTRGVPHESLKEYQDIMIGFRGQLSHEESLEWSKRQVYLALGILLAACAQKRVDACPMEGFDRAKYDEALSLKEKNLTAAVLCTVGYRGEDEYAKAKKVRFHKDDVFIFH